MSIYFYIKFNTLIEFSKEQKGKISGECKELNQIEPTKPKPT